MPDGSVKYVHVLACAVSGESGNVQYLGAVMDVTARIQAEEALRASELSFRLIVDSIPGLVSTMTPSGDAELVNERVMSYTGRDSRGDEGLASNDPPGGSREHRRVLAASGGDRGSVRCGRAYP